MDESPLLLKVHEAASLLGIGRSTAYELIAHGELPCLRIGGVMRVPRAALESWIQQATTFAPASRDSEERPEPDGGGDHKARG